MTENKGDLISREALKNIAYINKGNFNTVEGIREWIDNAPTVEIPNYGGQVVPDTLHGWRYEERPQGKWIELRDYDFKCSLCGFSIMDKYNYCPECGADMRGKADHLRDCENCIHHSENGCEVWECEFEKRSDV